MEPQEASRMEREQPLTVAGSDCAEVTPAEAAPVEPLASSSTKIGHGSLYLAVFIDSLGAFMVMPLLPYLAMSLGASAFDTSLMASVYCFNQVWGTVVLGALSDRFGRRVVLLLSLSMCSIVLLFFGLARTMWQLILFRGLHGVFASTVSICEAMVADSAKPEERAGAMATVMAAFGVGIVFGPGIGGLLSPLGFTWVCTIASAVTFLNFVWAFCQTRGVRPSAQAPNHSNVAAEVDSAGNTTRSRCCCGSICQTVLLIGRAPSLLMWYIMAFLQTASMGSFVGVAAYFMLDEYDIQARENGLIFSLAGVTMVLCQSIVTKIAVRHLGETGSIFVGSVIRAAGICLLILIPRAQWVPCVATVVLVCSGSLIDPSMAAQVASSAGEDTRGAALGIYQALRSLGETLGPLLAGSMYAHSHHAPILLSVGLSASCALILALASLPFCKARAPSQARDTLLSNGRGSGAV